MFFSPFPLWIRCLFIFGSLPLYEYSVIARNYGINMLLLFIGAMIYPNQKKHPFRLAFILALLANTNIHSAILTGIITAVWAWETYSKKMTSLVQTRPFSLYRPFIIVFTGLLLCAAITIPDESTIVVPVFKDLSMNDFIPSMFYSVFRPDKTFSSLAHRLPSFLSVSVLYLAVFGLLHKPKLFIAALSAQTAFGLLFVLVYRGSSRHQDLFLIFLIFLYWISIRSLHNRNKKSAVQSGTLYYNAYTVFIKYV